MINNSVFLHNLVLRYLRAFFKSIRIKELSTAFLCMGFVKDFFRVCRWFYALIAIAPESLY